MEDHLKADQSEYLPLRDVVFQTLRHAILFGGLKPGERLMEISLAKRLGVSRTPLREAMRMLEQEGLITMIPRKGAEVARITKKDVEDVLEVRCVLEKLAIELACIKITGEQIQQLKQTVKEFKALMDKPDITALAEKDVAFHDIIFAATENRRLIQIINNLREQMYRYRVEHLKDIKTHSLLVKEHEAMIADLEHKNVEDAGKHIVEHIYNQVTAVSRFIE